jgi:hypothetical protein
LNKRSKAQSRLPVLCPVEHWPEFTGKLRTVFGAEKLQLLDWEEAKAHVIPVKNRRSIINKAIHPFSWFKILMATVLTFLTDESNADIIVTNTFTPSKLLLLRLPNVIDNSNSCAIFYS